MAALTVLLAAGAAADSLLTEPEDLESQVDAVSDGPLRFLTTEPTGRVHVHRNSLVIGEASLGDGWVRLQQCHEVLDPVPALQVVYGENLRSLRIDQASGVGSAWVDGRSVQVREVGRDARLCVGAEVKALASLGQGVYRLRNGPYMRRFLDGFYAMKVEIAIDYPGQLLRPLHSVPAPQPGFEVQHAPGLIRASAIFDGRLFTCFDFCASTQGVCPRPPASCE